MRKPKIQVIHLLIATVVICIGIVASLYYTVITNTKKEIEALNVRYEKASAVASERPKLEKQLAEAKQKFIEMTAKLDVLMKEKMPPISFDDRIAGMMALWKENTQVLGPMIVRWMNRGPLIANGNVSIPAPPVNPNGITYSLLTYNLGSFTVTGDFRSILDHVRDWNNFGRLVRVDGLTLNGQSPNMTGTYTVTMFIIPYGGVGPEIPMAGGGGPGGGGGGGAGYVMEETDKE